MITEVQGNVVSLAASLKVVSLAASLKSDTSGFVNIQVQRMPDYPIELTVLGVLVIGYSLIV